MAASSATTPGASGIQPSSGGPWASLGYVALLAGVLLAVAIAVADRRDA